MYRRYRDKGKTTLYAPGVASSWLTLLPLAVYSWSWLAGQPFVATDIVIGLCITFGIAACLIMIPLGINFRVKSANFAFTRKGYFDRFE